MKGGPVRADLYYRPNVVVLHMRALRKRGEDIPLLASFFLNHIRNLNITNALNT